MSAREFRVLFVCLGNICRSPLAEGAFRHALAKHPSNELRRVVRHDSAGTGPWHVGAPPDPRAIRIAKDHGVDIADLRGRQVTPVLAMDRHNLEELEELEALASPLHTARVRLFRDYDPAGRGDVPDPYRGGPEEFERVFAMIDRTATALLDAISSEKERAIR
jgi:protein-tyrosine phosphatase